MNLQGDHFVLMIQQCCALKGYHSDRYGEGEQWLIDRNLLDTSDRPKVIILWRIHDTKTGGGGDEANKIVPSFRLSQSVRMIQQENSEISYERVLIKFVQTSRFWLKSDKYEYNEQLHEDLHTFLSVWEV